MHDFVWLWCGKIKGAFEAHKWPSVKNLINDMQFRGFFSVSLIFEFLRSFSKSIKKCQGLNCFRKVSFVTFRTADTENIGDIHRVFKAVFSLSSYILVLR